jgi:hypothetical protein
VLKNCSLLGPADCLLHRAGNASKTDEDKTQDRFFVPVRDEVYIAISYIVLIRTSTNRTLRSYPDLLKEQK